MTVAGASGTGCAFEYAVGDQFLDDLLLHAKGTDEAFHRHDHLLGRDGAQFLIAVLALNRRDGAEIGPDEITGDRNVHDGVGEVGLHGLLISDGEAPARRLE